MGTSAPTEVGGSLSRIRLAPMPRRIFKLSTKVVRKKRPLGRRPFATGLIGPHRHPTASWSPKRDDRAALRFLAILLSQSTELRYPRWRPRRRPIDGCSEQLSTGRNAGRDLGGSNEGSANPLRPGDSDTPNALGAQPEPASHSRWLRRILRRESASYDSNVA